MRLNNKFVGQITEEDLLQLITDGRREDQHLDFKRDAYPATDSGRKSLIDDVLSFANASGGVILIGIAEERDKAREIPGVELESAREPMERYRRTVEANTEPMLTGIQISEIELRAAGRFVIAIGIPSSPVRPHRSKTTGYTSGRWTIRRNTNVSDMTYHELRSGFSRLDESARSLRAFHADRCKFANDFVTRNNLTGLGGHLVLHVIPLGPEGIPFDLPKALTLRQQFVLPGEHMGMIGLQPDLDGVIASARLGDDRNWGWGWVKVRRDGWAEGVMGNYARFDGMEGDTGRKLTFNHPWFERSVRDSVKGYIEGLVQLGFNPPFAVAVSLLNAHECIIDRLRSRPKALGRPVATLDPVIVQEYASDRHYDVQLRSLFDQLWNGFGFNSCPSFDDAGNWRGSAEPVNL